ncbi:MAG: TlyA family RNA methyltransferase [Acuticoccus sp.]
MRVDGVPARRASQSVPEGAAIEAERDPYASRAAHKLLHALDTFALDPEGTAALDVGASTGGFTDVLLRRGARQVIALDVGHDQLVPALRADPRVIVMEGCNARELDGAALPFAPDFLSFDVSFISLAKVLPACLAVAAPGAQLAALVKPQFEVGRAAIGKGGIVRDSAAAEAAVAHIEATVAALGWRVLGRTPSPIVGGDGNAEWLIGARRP